MNPMEPIPTVADLLKQYRRETLPHQYKALADEVTHYSIYKAAVDADPQSKDAFGEHLNREWLAHCHALVLAIAEDLASRKKLSLLKTPEKQKLVFSSKRIPDKSFFIDRVAIKLNATLSGLEEIRVAIYQMVDSHQ